MIKGLETKPVEEILVYISKKERKEKKIGYHSSVT